MVVQFIHQHGRKLRHNRAAGTKGKIDGGVLEGVRVLDFGRYIAGPYCATLLAEFGAEVIRVERRDGSEDRFVAPVGEGGEGALFLQVNRNKKCITLDPMKPEGQEVMRRLVATADVVVANLPPQTLRAMKLDYDSLKAIKPDIILTTATAFGGPGPWSDRVGFDGVGQVMSGAVYTDGQGRSAVPGGGELGRFRHRAALRVRHARRPDRARQIRARPDRRGRAAGDRALLHQRNADRAGGDIGQSRADRQPRPDRGARRYLPHQRRLGAVPGHRASAVHPLGQIDGRGGSLAEGSAFRRRSQARRQRP